ncbi:Ribonuclease H A1VMW5 [Pyrrhoderma noxium]|uniref:Ribonuclease H A1VMW5 n=1 Tax=Pyrrhoderma noxium TaxID=2282107 RepID=A0A286UDV3_9AGAM|nr:Ribonuclease H A1VMW5 [Pyrrhoderma noxium]
MYFGGKSIGTRRDRHSPSSTAFDAELFAIYKALQMAQSRLSFSSSTSTRSINKVIIYTDSSSSLQLLSTNPSKFLHHPLYVKIFELVTSLLTDFPVLTINLNWCPGHKGVIGNEEADLQAGKACVSRIPTSTPITSSFCSLVSTKDLLDNCTYYWEAYKELPVSAPGSSGLLRIIAFAEPTTSDFTSLKIFLAHAEPLVSKM